MEEIKNIKTIVDLDDDYNQKINSYFEEHSKKLVLDGNNSLENDDKAEVKKTVNVVVETDFIAQALRFHY